ncbi:hypothetical protein [Streptomyces platensis]|uniref:hypothetical protein n=1 Tax=Streptomyces platensis TaxID=58346 RepID=UPI0037976229
MNFLKSKGGAVYEWSKAKATKAWKVGKKKGVAYLKKQISKLSNWSLTKWAWRIVLATASGADYLWQLIKLLSGH